MQLAAIVISLAVTLVTVALAARTVAHIVAVVRLGQPAAQRFEAPWTRLATMLRFRVRFLHEAARHRQAVNDEIYGQLRPLYMPRREKYLALETRGARHNIGVKYGVVDAQIALALAGVDRERMLAGLLESIVRIEQTSE